MSRLAIKRLLLVLVSAMLTQFGVSRAFELVEIQLDITIQEDFSHNFAGTAHTGFSIVNPDLASLELQSSFLPQFGLLENESVQDGFVLFDGTLWLQVTDLDAAGGRADIRTTYRIDVDPRMLRRDFLRARFVRQLEMDEGRALARARAASRADVRMMRFVEDDARWVRAGLRAAEGRARFVGRMEPDGRIGHYGQFTASDGGSYVWTVLDRNSRYAVGLSLDWDEDGIVNGEDNCPAIANSDQVDTDGNGDGDACDGDIDGDEIPNDADNCPLMPNSDQADADGDDIGDVCDLDADNDEVNDGLDACPDTLPGAIVNADGCSIAQLCPCDNAWRNHGAYVRCTARTAEAFLAAALVTAEDKDEVVSAAAESACGARH